MGLIILSFCSLSSSSSIFLRMANGTDRALWNLGWTLASTWSLAVTPWTVPSSSLKTPLCLSSTPWRVRVAFSLKISLQSNLSADNQSLPSKVGPFPWVTMSGRDAACVRLGLLLIPLPQLALQCMSGAVQPT